MWVSCVRINYLSRSAPCLLPRGLSTSSRRAWKQNLLALALRVLLAFASRRSGFGLECCRFKYIGKLWQWKKCFVLSKLILLCYSLLFKNLLLRFEFVTSHLLAHLWSFFFQQVYWAWLGLNDVWTQLGCGLEMAWPCPQSGLALTLASDMLCSNTSLVSLSLCDQTKPVPTTGRSWEVNRHTVSYCSVSLCCAKAIDTKTPANWEAFCRCFTPVCGHL